MIVKVDHTATAARDLKNAVKIWKKILDVEPISLEEVPEEGVRIAMSEVGGTFIELLEPISSESSITKFIEKRGKRISHTAFRVNDIVKFSKCLKTEGSQAIYEAPRTVSHGTQRINFIHPKSTMSVLVELVERVEKEWRSPAIF